MPAWPPPIFDHPDDDAPRLALAAELDARRDPRGELIRVQIELAARDPIGLDDAAFPGAEVEILARLRADRSPCRVELLARERRLLDTHGTAWRAPIESAVRACRMSPGETGDFVHRPNLIDKPVYAARFRRGFVDAVHMEASAFAADGAAALAIEPVRALRLYRPARLLASICASPALARIEALVLGDEGIYQHDWDCIDDDDLGDVVAGASFASSLRELDLGFSRLGEPGIRRLAERPFVANLEALFIPGCEVGNWGLETLLDSPHVRGLAALDLGSSRLGRTSAMVLSRVPSLERLSLLWVVGNKLGTDGTAALRERFGEGLVVERIV